MAQLPVHCWNWWHHVAGGRWVLLWLEGGKQEKVPGAAGASKGTAVMIKKEKDVRR